MKLQARDQRIGELNKQILKLKEEMREQSEWNAMQLAQLRMTQDAEKKRDKKPSKKQVDLDEISKHGKVVKPMHSKKIVEQEEKSEWDEI